MARFLRLMILGPPGSGKSTIGKKIADTFQLKHVSSGDVLRDHVTQETPIGKQAQEYINTGDAYNYMLFIFECTYIHVHTYMHVQCIYVIM